MEEMFDIYRRDGKHLGIKPKSFCHSKNPGVYHKPVWTWIINSNGEILVQQRAETNENNINYWDMSYAGHTIAGEKPIETAIREAKEELGIVTTKKDYLYIGEYISDSDMELAQIYLLKIDIEASEIKFQEEEVKAVKWLTLTEFEKLFYSNEFEPCDNEYKTLIMNLLKSKIIG